MKILDAIFKRHTVAKLQRDYQVLQQCYEDLDKNHANALLALHSVRSNYLDLLINVISGSVYKDAAIINGTVSPYNKEIREHGWDWPMHAHSMIGVKRLNNVRSLVESVLGNKIPGDLIETGVWRGGACILMRAVLHIYGIQDRKVFVADSFEGLPFPNAEQYSADTESTFHSYAELAVPLEKVQENFAAYNMLDSQVVFVKGWFKDTLPLLESDRLALLRLDGDMYESTMDALENLYGKLSSGGYVIVDDYHVVPACKQAVHDFCAAHAVDPVLEEIDDGVGVYWRKSEEAQPLKNG